MMLLVRQILKVIGCLKNAHRYYATRRGMNYYEVLGVKNDATKQDIRAAFLNRSKQVHPDAGNKTDHADFVRVTEAYNVLSKEHTRREYDDKLNYASNYRHHRSYRSHRNDYHYRASGYDNWDTQRQYGSKYYYQYEYNPYHNLGRNRPSKATIVFTCVFISAVGFVLQMLAVVYSPTFNRQQMLENSERQKAILQKLQEEVNGHKNADENLQAFWERIDTSDDN